MMRSARAWSSLVWVGLVAVLAPGCRPAPPGPLDDLPGLEGRVPDPARLPSPAGEAPQTVCLRQILVAFRGVFEPKVKVRWNLTEARLRAERLCQLARSAHGDFAELAKHFSDAPDTSGDGGDLGVVQPGQMHPDLERAGFGLQLGQVSDPVLTPRGLVILQRQEPDEAQAAEIVISYTGAKRYRPRTPRSREEAAELARQVHQRLVAGADFAEQARDFSDRPDWERGGFELIFKRGAHRFPQFEKIVWDLPVGAVSEPVETSSGFHIVSRWPVVRLQLRVMKFRYAPEGLDAPVDDQRAGGLPSRQQALALAEQLRSQVLDEGADFAALAVHHTDPAAQQKGGLAENIGRGEIPYPVERAAFALQIGQVSEVIDAGGVLFLLKRVP